jgi:glycosyltransferase involved in cell wall biosynthesis
MREPGARIASIRIVARTNKVGMDRDIRLLREALGASPTPVTFSHYRSISPLRRFFDRRRPDECLIFLERITARWLRRAGQYILIPNQERFARRLVPLLSRIDHIFCKTRHAEEIFARLHPSVHYLGFTSVDRRSVGTSPDFSRFFHLAGGSSLKGTATLLALWERHPEWPELTLVQHRGDPPAAIPANVRLIHRYLPDEELRDLQNACGIHLCPSSSEGWGHSIVEAMSCGALVVTTDAPPMNELVRPERGVLVPWSSSEPRKLGVNYYVDTGRLEETIDSLARRSEEEKRSMGIEARRWFEENDREFRLRLEALATSLIAVA